MENFGKILEEIWTKIQVSRCTAVFWQNGKCIIYYPFFGRLTESDGAAEENI